MDASGDDVDADVVEFAHQMFDLARDGEAERLGRVWQFHVGSRACASRPATLRSLEGGPATSSLPRLAGSGAQTRSLIDAELPDTA